MSWRQKFTQNLIQLTFNFKSDSPKAQGIIKFVKKYYADLKTLNPCFPFLVRDYIGDVEERHTAFIDVIHKAHYLTPEKFHETIDIAGKNEEEILEILKSVVIKAEGYQQKDLEGSKTEWIDIERDYEEKTINGFR